MTQPWEPPRAPETLRLGDLLGALLHEFSRAAVASDATRAFWKEVYLGHEALAEDKPATIRIVEASLSLPVALYEVVGGPRLAPTLATHHIEAALPVTLAPDARRRWATAIHAEAVRAGPLRLDHGGLPQRLREAARRVAGAPGLDEASLQGLQKTLREAPLKDHATRVQYRSEDLRALGPERLLRLEVKVALDYV
ncbi:MAG: hypothetical protein LC623_02485 [Halobacteriales archaeon]|nr:hypothetical protein [Halobacteriales archaeon]